VALAALQELERDAVMGTYARNPVEFVRGAGTRLWDDEGNEYLDFLCGISVSLLGHCHPAVVEAVRDQATRLIHVGNLFYTDPPMRLAARLSELSLGGKVFFANSGAEAIECALKLARKRRQGGDFVVLERGFHGRTYGALSATPQESKQAPFAPLVPGFVAVEPTAEAVRAAVHDGTAAVLLEPVQGEGGVNPATPAYFQGVRRLCDERGCLLIVDEVQTGLGRTGEWFGFQHLGIEPDVVTMAKALGNGVPIGACWARDDVAAAFVPGDHATTFGGQPLATAAARAVLEVMQREDVPARATAAGERLTKGLESISAIARVRGLGLLVAAELRDRPSREVVAAALDAGLVVNAVTETALRLAPSLLVTDDEIDEAVAILTMVLA